jgi:outer membrane cobalamin receptor
MKKKFILIYLFFLLAYPGQITYSQVIPNPDDSLRKELSEVVVTANRYGSVRINTPEAIRMLDSRKVARQQIRTAPEALALTPGVFIQKTNHGGGSPFLRGLTGNQTLLLIDGIRLSNSVVRYGPNQYFNTIDLFSAEKFEVMRGSGSVQYGSDAIGGTIQAFSHDLNFSKNPQWNGTALARISTHGMEKTSHGNVVFSNNKLAFRGGVTARKFGDLIGGDTTGRQTPTGYDEIDFDMKAKVSLGQSSQITMLLQRVHQSDIPVYHKIVLEDYSLNRMNPQQRMLGYLRLNQDISDGFLKSAIITASLQQNNETRESRKNESAILKSEKDRVRTFSLSAEALATAGDIWSSNSGFELYNDLIKSSRTDFNSSDEISSSFRGLYPDGSTMTSLALYSLHSLEYGNWNITGGLRYNSYINRISDQNLGEITLKPSAFVASIAILRKIAKSSTLFISAGSGFRAPNIDDLGTLGIVDFRYETPDYSLKPEHSLQYQAGYKLKTRNVSGELFIYRNELQDLIVRNRVEGDETVEGYPVYIKENVEKAFVRGLETAWDFKISRSLSLSGTLTGTYGKNQTKNEPMRRIPPLFGRVFAQYSKNNWIAGLEWLAASKQDRLAKGDKEDNRIPAGGSPGWNIINLNGGFSCNGLILDMSVINLFNADYRYHGSGVNGTGRSVFLTISVNW